MLNYPPFQAVGSLLSTAKGGPTLKTGQRGPGVAVVQAALLQLGAKMPKTSAHGSSSGPQGREYEMDFEYKFYDRYNWDAGKKVTIFGITVTDCFMGEFHRQGLAREYDCFGSVRRKLTWKQGESLSVSQLRQAGAGRS